MKVELKPWDYTCADGCCSDSGVDVFIDGTKVTEYGNQDHVLIAAILNHLGHDCEIVGLDTDGEIMWTA